MYNAMPINARVARPSRGAIAPSTHTPLWGAHTLSRTQEDEQLRRLVASHGPQKWSVVAEKVKGRSGKSCRLRCVALARGGERGRKRGATTPHLDTH